MRKKEGGRGRERERKREREREREREKERERQTDITYRQKDIQTYRRIDRQTERERERERAWDRQRSAERAGAQATSNSALHALVLPGVTGWPYDVLSACTLMCIHDRYIEITCLLLIFSNNRLYKLIAAELIHSKLKQY